MRVCVCRSQRLCARGKPFRGSLENQFLPRPPVATAFRVSTIISRELSTRLGAVAVAVRFSFVRSFVCLGREELSALGYKSSQIERQRRGFVRSEECRAVSICSAGFVFFSFSFLSSFIHQQAPFARSTRRRPVSRSAMFCSLYSFWGWLVGWCCSAPAGALPSCIVCILPCGRAVVALSVRIIKSNDGLHRAETSLGRAGN